MDNDRDNQRHRPDPAGVARADGALVNIVVCIIGGIVAGSVLLLAWGESQRARNRERGRRLFQTHNQAWRDN